MMFTPVALSLVMGQHHKDSQHTHQNTVQLIVKQLNKTIRIIPGKILENVYSAPHCYIKMEPNPAFEPTTASSGTIRVSDVKY